MRLELKHYDTIMSIEQPFDDMTLEQFMDEMVRPMVRLMGYSEDQIKEWFEND